MEASDKQHLGQKYYGAVAKDYEAKRRAGPHWDKEQAAAERMLKSVKPEGGLTVIDIPVGTGRFAPIYRKLGTTLIGQDISEDMLTEARKACDAVGLPDATLEVGDAFAIALPDDAVDVALCVRFMQHVDFAAFQTVIAELTRVARSHVLLGIHMVQDEKRGYDRIIRAALTSPMQTLKRLKRGWGSMLYHRKRAKTAAPGSAETYMKRADKSERAVFAEFDKLRLKVVDQAEILVSLRPGKAISYRFLLLQVPR